MKAVFVIFTLISSFGFCAEKAAVAVPPAKTTRKVAQEFAKKLYYVRFETEKGTIDILVDGIRAPGTAQNFLNYVSLQRYDGGLFHRTVTMNNQDSNKFKIEVVQAGPSSTNVDFPPIPLERTSVTHIKHVAGTISMARDGADSATSDFFICLSDQPELDFHGRRNPDGQGFAAFGQILKGMNAVRAIHQSPENGQTLTPPIKILKAYVLNQAP